MLFEADWQLFVVKYVVLCKLHFFLGMRPPFSEKPLVNVVTKCGPVILLITSVAMDLIDKRSQSTDVTGEYILLSGLVFSVIGDACLVYPSCFLLGLLSFAGTQVLYTALFDGGPRVFFDADQWEIAAALTIAIISLSVYCGIFSNMGKLTKPLAFLYCCLISVMLWSAVVKVRRETTDWTLFGAAGAGFFYTSDLLLAVNKWGVRIPLSPYLILGTYYTAQLFIVVSVLSPIHIA